MSNAGQGHDLCFGAPAGHFFRGFSRQDAGSLSMQDKGRACDVVVTCPQVDGFRAGRDILPDSRIKTSCHTPIGQPAHIMFHYMLPIRVAQIAEGGIGFAHITLGFLQIGKARRHYGEVLANLF